MSVTSVSTPARAFSDVFDYDPLRAEIAADPYPYYERLRDEFPVYHVSRLDAWALSRYADVDAAFKDATTFYSRDGVIPDCPKGLVMLASMDGERHRSHRQVVQPRFTARQVAALAGRVRAITGELLADLAPGDTADLAERLATPPTWPSGWRHRRPGRAAGDTVARAGHLRTDGDPVREPRPRPRPVPPGHEPHRR